MNLPLWFKNGLIDYLSKDWDTDLDNNLKDLILSKKTEKFNSLSKEEKALYTDMDYGDILMRFSEKT